MDSIWFEALLAIIGAGIVQAILMALHAWEHWRRCRNSLSRLANRRSAGRTLVVVPCKGRDVELEGNLRALFQQDHPDYEVTFVVESAEDAACSAIQAVRAEFPAIESRLIVAGRSDRSGQKVHNLLAATEHLSPEIEHLAFLDSDSRPRSHWLRMALSRLDRRGIGAATGYRWFIPTRPSWANHALASINTGVMALLIRKRHRLLWGGAWALNRSTFETIGVRRAWEGMLSDDLVASRAIRRAGLFTRFEPGCVVASPIDFSMREAFGFLRRQYLITRHYAFGWWIFALATASIRVFAWLASFVLLALGIRPWICLAAIAILYAANVCRGSLMQRAGRLYFPEEAETLRGARRFDLWAAPIAGAIQWLGLIASAWGRQIDWREIRYVLRAGGRIESIARRDPSAVYEPVGSVFSARISPPLRAETPADAEPNRVAALVSHQL